METYTSNISRVQPGIGKINRLAIAFMIIVIMFATAIAVTIEISKNNPEILIEVKR